MKKKFSRRLAACVFAVIVIAGFVLNFNSFSDDFSRLLTGRTSLYSMSRAVPEKLRSGLFAKEALVELHGLFDRITGKRISNQVMKLADGSLVEESVPRVDMAVRAEQVQGLHAFLSSRRIPFLYVQAPDKTDLSGQLLPTGAEYFANENASALLEGLKEKQIDCLDLRPDMSAQPQQVQQYFYRTDHHWNAVGAFRAGQLIADRINQTLQCDTASVLDENQWQLQTKLQFFLGSRGKRVGRYFAGIDDLQWMIPGFDTDMTTILPMTGVVKHGGFASAKLNTDIINKSPDLFHDNPYTIYMGDVYGLVRHINRNAPADKKVLLVGDSFMLPLQCYLSAAYKEVDVVDLRYYQIDSIDIGYVCAETLAQYIDDTSPDMVVMMLSPTMVTDERFYRFGLRNDQVNPDDEAANLRMVYADVSDTDDTQLIAEFDNVALNDTAICSLEKGKRYRVTIQNTDENAAYAWICARDTSCDENRMAQMLLLDNGQGAVSFYTTMRSEVGPQSLFIKAFDENGAPMEAMAGKLTVEEYTQQEAQH